VGAGGGAEAVEVAGDGLGTADLDTVPLVAVPITEGGAEAGREEDPDAEAEATRPDPDGAGPPAVAHPASRTTAPSGSTVPSRSAPRCIRSS
jgi:hypothetical protein